MIYTDIQLKEKIMQMLESFESEVVEFKEAKTNYSFNDIGKYFSALSNEANIRGFQEAWLVFGISNDKKFTGTEFRKQGGLQSLKKELVNGTNERLTFLEIYELSMHKCRIIAFQIPPAIRGIPTTWQGAAYAREHESLCPLPMNKVDLIRSQIGMDWSKEIVKEASVEDLDPAAVKKRESYFQNDRAIGEKLRRFIRNRGLEDDICKQLIVKALEAMGEASKREIMEVLENALPEVLDEGQKSKKVSNLLQAMKKEGLVAAEGKTRHAKWILQQKE